MRPAVVLPIAACGLLVVACGDDPGPWEDVGNGHMCVTADGVQVWPEGCWSSSCTEIGGFVCEGVLDGDTLTLDVRYRLRDRDRGDDCTTDCGGAQRCDVALPGPSGRYTLVAGETSFAFDVPVGAAGVCGGDF